MRCLVSRIQTTGCYAAAAVPAVAVVAGAACVDEAAAVWEIRQVPRGCMAGGEVRRGEARRGEARWGGVGPDGARQEVDVPGLFWERCVLVRAGEVTGRRTRLRTLSARGVAERGAGP